MKKGSGVMVSMYMFEKLFYKSENINACSFPVLSECEFMNMEIEAFHDSESVRCFAYYRHSGSNAYIDIYVWDVMLQNRYKRFVIAEDYSFSQEDEKLFLEYMSGNIVIEDDMVRDLVYHIKKEHSDLHIELYSDPRHVLLHTYYTFHRNGIYEILFKANLNWIAVNLDRFEDYNIIGCSPQEIFYTHVEVLRAFNYAGGIECIITLYDREVLNNLYAAFHNYIRGRRMNKYQVLYLKDIYYSGEKLNKKMYEFLGKLWKDSQYYAYLRYRDYKQVVDDYYSILPKYPKLVDLEEMCEICDWIEGYIENEGYYNWRYSQYFYDNKRKYEYENDRYQMIIPKDVSDILREAAQQHNCLYRYVWRVASGDTVILFMRDKGNPSKSLVTLEVKHNAIVQAYRAFNKLPNEQEQKFIEEFAKEKRLCFETEYDEDDDDWIEEEDEAV
ncbi:MAG: PcfJ domain-containing protein [Acetatifactor sp.]|nr:PcfJ domain-containing protein [Acetatifactor sp.]